MAWHCEVAALLHLPCQFTEASATLVLETTSETTFSLTNCVIRNTDTIFVFPSYATLLLENLSIIGGSIRFQQQVENSGGFTVNVSRCNATNTEHAFSLKCYDATPRLCKVSNVHLSFKDCFLTAKTSAASLLAFDIFNSSISVLNTQILVESSAVAVAVYVGVDTQANCNMNNVLLDVASSNVTTRATSATGLAACVGNLFVGLSSTARISATRIRISKSSVVSSATWCAAAGFVVRGDQKAAAYLFNLTIYVEESRVESKATNGAAASLGVFIFGDSVSLEAKDVAFAVSRSDVKSEAWSSGVSVGFSIFGATITFVGDRLTLVSLHSIVASNCTSCCSSVGVALLAAFSCVPQITAVVVYSSSSSINATAGESVSAAVGIASLTKSGSARVDDVLLLGVGSSVVAKSGVNCAVSVGVSVVDTAVSGSATCNISQATIAVCSSTIASVTPVHGLSVGSYCSAAASGASTAFRVFHSFVKSPEVCVVGAGSAGAMDSVLDDVTLNCSICGWGNMTNVTSFGRSILFNGQELTSTTATQYFPKMAYISVLPQPATIECEGLLPRWLRPLDLPDRGSYLTSSSTVPLHETSSRAINGSTSESRTRSTVSTSFSCSIVPTHNLALTNTHTAVVDDAGTATVSESQRVTASVAVTSSVALSAVVSNNALEMQSLVVLSFSSTCSSPYLKKTLSSASHLVTVFDGASVLLKVAGNIGVCLCALILHFFAVLVVWFWKSGTLQSSCSCCRFPSLSYKVFILMFQGQLLESLRVLVNSDSEQETATVIAAVIGLVVCVTVLFAASWHAHRLSTSVPYLQYTTAFDRYPRIFRIVLPHGFWEPSVHTRKWSSLWAWVALRNGGSAAPADPSSLRVCLLVLLPFFRPSVVAVISIMTAIPCTIQRVLMIALSIGMICSTVVLKPHRVGLSALTAVVSDLLLACIVALHFAPSDLSASWVPWTLSFTGFFSSTILVFSLIFSRLESRWIRPRAQLFAGRECVVRSNG